MFWSVGWPLLRTEGFFYNLDIPYGGLGIGKLQFLIKKNNKKFSAVIFFQFWSLKPWIRIGLQHQTLDPDPDPEKMNTDPQPCIQHVKTWNFFFFFLWVIFVDPDPIRIRIRNTGFCVSKNHNVLYLSLIAVFQSGFRIRIVWIRAHSLDLNTDVQTDILHFFRSFHCSKKNSRFLLILTIIQKSTISPSQRLRIKSKFVAGTFESSWAMWMFPS